MDGKRMIQGKPQMTYGGGYINAPERARQNAGMPAGRRVGADFASYLPAPAQGKQSKQAMSAQYAFQAQPASFGQSEAHGVGQGLPAQSPQQMRNHTNAKTRAGAMPVGTTPLATARSRGNADARAYSAMNNAGISAQQSQPVRNKKAPRVSGRPVTGRNNIGMEDTRTNRSGKQSRAVAKSRQPRAEALPVAQPQQQSLGILQSGRGRLADMGPDAFFNFAARFQHSPLSQGFVTQGFASKNAKAVMQSQGFDLNPSKNVRTKARLLAAPTRQEKAVEEVKKKKIALPKETYAAPSLVPTFFAMANQQSAATTATGTEKQEMGALAAKFESGEEGIAAIGYDRKGGTSYGKYQISSRAGTMTRFISYLQDTAPDIAKHLITAGPANTGSRRGKMPEVWRQIAVENPQRFERLQSDFIHTSHFEPAINGIANATGISFDDMPKALQEVLFSTAVQHGPEGAVRIVSRAVNSLDKTKRSKLEQAEESSLLQAGQQLIKNIYNLRTRQFASSTTRVQAAVRNRLRMEMREALGML